MQPIPELELQKQDKVLTEYFARIIGNGDVSESTSSWDQTPESNSWCLRVLLEAVLFRFCLFMYQIGTVGISQESSEPGEHQVSGCYSPDSCAVYRRTSVSSSSRGRKGPQDCPDPKAMGCLKGPLCEGYF